MENPVGKDVIKEGGNYIWPMTRLALPSQLRPVTSTQKACSLFFFEKALL